MPGSSARVSCIGARRFTSSARSICSGSKSSTRPLAGSAALATSTSTAPAASASRAGPSRSARSSATASARSPRLALSSSSSSSRRPLTTTVAPRAWSARASAPPMPPVAPVTSTLAPASCTAGKLPKRAAYARQMLRAPIRLGLQIPNFNFPGVDEEQLFEQLSDIATTAESSGFDTVLVMDHLHQIRGVGPPENWMLEGNAILCGLAARTERVNLSLLVGATTYRNPALHAKTTTTLDVDLRRPRDPRHRRGMERGRGHGIWLRLPVAQGALRAARGPPQHRARDVHRLARELRGHAPQHHGRVQQPAADPRRHPDHDRRQRREEDAADGGAVRRRVELLRRPGADQAPRRRPRGALRALRPRPGGDHQDPPRHRSSSSPPRRRPSARSSASRETAACPPTASRPGSSATPTPSPSSAASCSTPASTASSSTAQTSTSLETVELIGKTLGPLCSDVPSGRSSVG